MRLLGPTKATVLIPRPVGQKATDDKEQAVSTATGQSPMRAPGLTRPAANAALQASGTQRDALPTPKPSGAQPRRAHDRSGPPHVLGTPTSQGLLAPQQRGQAGPCGFLGVLPTSWGLPSPLGRALACSPRPPRSRAASRPSSAPRPGPLPPASRPGCRARRSPRSNPSSRPPARTPLGRGGRRARRR